MRGAVAKRLRKEAQAQTIGRTSYITRRIYRHAKRAYYRLKSVTRAYTEMEPLPLAKRRPRRNVVNHTRTADGVYEVPKKRTPDV